MQYDAYPNLKGSVADPKYNSDYHLLQQKELNKLWFFELKAFDFLALSLSQVQRNLRNIIALWAKDLGLNKMEDSDDPEGSDASEKSNVEVKKNTKKNKN